MRIIRLLLLVVWPVWAFAGGFEVADPPPQVDHLPLPEVNPDRLAHAESGRYHLMRDHQVWWQDGHRYTYVRFATKVLNRAGLEDVGTLLYTYMPETETLQLVRLNVVRGDQVLDMRDRVEPRFFRREEDLDEGIINGEMSVHISVPGLRTGDTVDAAFVWIETPVIPQLAMSAGEQFAYAVPLGHARLRVLWPEGRPLATRIEGAGPTARIEQAGALRAHVWEALDPEPYRPESHLPAGTSGYPTVRVSGLGDWGDVVDGILPHYTLHHPLPTDWQARMQQIMHDHTRPEDRAVAALRIVQDEIRYVGIEIGAGGYIARTPEHVIARGYGDCKDKSVLLQTLLREMGIEAVLALAHTEKGHTLPEAMPSNRFDHMIVGVMLNGQTRWVDPTRNFEAGRYENLVAPDYGYVLPIRPGQTQLEPIDRAPTSDYVVEVEETYNFGLLGVRLDVVTNNRGAAANRRRSEWAHRSLSDIGERYMGYFQSRYPGLIQMHPPRYFDDEDENVVTVREAYLLPPNALNAEALRTDFPFGAEDLLPDLPRGLDQPRQLPLALGTPYRREHVVRIKNAPIEFAAPDPVVIENPAFRYEFTAEDSAGGFLTLRWSYEGLSREVQPDDAQQVVEDASRGRQNRTWYWDLTPED
ncbi:DUF3857 domain-containing transglutaminase family protein [Actibacterium sp. XHP0104]|uniref:DUF3857 domain-containing transglutaminase family protein n=1 Tax=Actibacterium sp. XHP0104 TaxID=2984335 RepID=UPI0021E88890|nr:DUF3857 domain-containing transglutaminase family protein [Actibacterium sp. XHP0104]MCV2882314.1 DUF3857 domain-containing protein [Actibacterium sp. XHP0104]